jgi:hypothetical protein
MVMLVASICPLDHVMSPTVVFASFGGAASTVPPELDPLPPPLLPPLPPPLPPPEPLPPPSLELPVSPPGPEGPPLLEEQAAPKARAGTTRALNARRGRCMIAVLSQI